MKKGYKFFISILLVCIFFFLPFGSSIKVEAAEQTSSLKPTQTLLIGDSRLFYLCENTPVEDYFYVLCQGGADSSWIDKNGVWSFASIGGAYNTLTNDGTGSDVKIELSESLLKSKGITTIIYMIGINDLFIQNLNAVAGLEMYNAQEKIETNLQLLKDKTGCRVVYNNIGFIDMTKTSNAYYVGVKMTSNAQIAWFNYLLNWDEKVDCYSGAPCMESVDGVHYAAEDSSLIFYNINLSLWQLICSAK